jgi:alpha-mannosidase
MRISSVDPTVLFADVKGRLQQAVDVVIDNPSEPAAGEMEFRLPSGVVVCPLERMEHGKGTYRISIPDVRECVPATIHLKVGGEILDQMVMEWRPRKHWEIYLTPIAHHDLGYTDTIEGVLRKYRGIYEDVLRFCEETEDWPEESRFRYMVEQAWSIQHFIAHSSAETRAKLARYVRQGRIELPAFFGNEISGLCSHEELIRLMYPSFRMAREFGAPIRAAGITDIPGLSWGLPTVLAGAGVKYFFAGLPIYFQWAGLPAPFQKEDIHDFWDEASVLRAHGRPDAFFWKGPDGGKVLLFYQGGYGVWWPRSCQDVINQLPGMLNQMDAKGCPFSVMRYGWSEGGDNRGTDLVVSRIVREWNSQWAYPRLIVATHSMFFEKLEEQCAGVRTFSGELPDTDYPVGAASTAFETALNRATHDRLHAAEKLSAIASMLNIGGRFPPGLSYDYPADAIRDAYENMLLFDEHAWGKGYNLGVVQDWAWNEKSRYAYKAAGLTETILSESAEAISASIDIQTNHPHIVVFNPLSFTRTDIVTVPRVLLEEHAVLVDAENGRKVLFQTVELDGPQAPAPHAAGRYALGQIDRRELMSLVFVAEDVPAMGYKTYRIEPNDGTPAAAAPADIEGIRLADTRIENRFYRIELNPRTGTVTSIYDKELGREVVDRQAPHQFNQLITRWVKTGQQENPVEAKIRKGQAGPVYGSLVVSASGAGCPQLTQEIILYADLKRIDFANRVLKDSTPAMEVYFAFPFNVENPDFHFEGTNSVIKPLRDQFPGSNCNYYAAQHWADVSDGAWGATLAPRDAHLLEFGGLWPCYVSQAHHGVTPPDFGAPFVREMTKGHMYSFILDSNFRTNFQATQQGDLLFRYSIATHEGGWREGQAKRFGWSVANPLVPAMVKGEQTGTLPGSGCFCELDKPNVLATAFKQAEDGKGFIIRVTEMEGVETRLTLLFPFVEIAAACTTNLVEEDEQDVPIQGQHLTVPIGPFGIRTLRIHVKHQD